MEYLLFILFCAGITEFIVISKIGLFIREHEFIKKNILLHDLFSCSMCTGFWVGCFLSFYFEYENSNMLLINSVFGPILYGFLSLITSFIICSLSCVIDDAIKK